MSSQHLQNVIERHNQIANMQVVFCDIEKYSKRRSLSQIEIIDLFTKHLKQTVEEMSKHYISYCHGNNVNFQKDIVIIPTGDGAAIAFTFDGLHDAHLIFSKALLKRIDEHNKECDCDKFNEKGWCNCHDSYNLSIGISEGKGIIFRDINDNYNIAGSVINFASRAMIYAERNQIMFTEEAYNQIIDMVEDKDLIDKFSVFENVKIKHNKNVNLYQFVDYECSYINSDPPRNLIMKQKMNDLMSEMGMGLPFGNNINIEGKDAEDKLMKMAENLGGIMRALKSDFFNPEAKEPPQIMTKK